MDKQHYEEMKASLNELEQEKIVQSNRIYLFGHCNATEELADLLLKKGYQLIAILDNNVNKQGYDYRGIPIVPPEAVLREEQENILVCIVARAYAAMVSQLKRLGFRGQIRKLVDYNSYADYSLSEETIKRMKIREERGRRILDGLSEKYPGYFKILCPFQALGDIYIMMSYLPYYLKKNGIEKCVICVTGNVCKEVVGLYCNGEDGETRTKVGNFKYIVETFSQKDIDELIQAVIFTQDKDSYIAHQDRPYVNNLYKALYIKRIPLELIYCCGVFGLPKETVPMKPVELVDYPQLNRIPQGKSVIFSPYAKSVTAIHPAIWKEAVEYYSSNGYKCYTNVVGDEVPLEGTEAISPTLLELQSVVERAGTFIGIRSGLCDVIREAKAKKIALYPDYNYCDTKWKAIEMYYIDKFEYNLLAEEGIKWEKL